MNPVLETYYERELAFLQEETARFAQRFPSEAGGLLPRTDLGEDPHLQRMMEAIALLAGRLHFKIDSEFPVLTESLLQILYPHLLRIIPSMAIAQMEYQPAESCPATGLRVEAGTSLYSQILGIPPVVCQYRTGYPVTMWPIRLVKANLEPAPFASGPQGPARTVAALRLELECLGDASFADLPLDKLRLFLNGPRHLVALLYEVIFNHTQQIVFRPLDSPSPQPSPPGGAKKGIRSLVLTPSECLSQVGFERDEALLPFPAESFVGYRLFTEFLSFPEKFLFVDLKSWQQVRSAGFHKKVEVVFFLNRTHPNLEQGVSAKTFLLGCTPIINLFTKSAEPLAVTQLHSEYRVVPGRPQTAGMEVFSVDSVTALDPVGMQVKEYLPFFTFPPAAILNPEGREVNSTDQVSSWTRRQGFWHAARRVSPLDDDPGTEVYMTLVDPDFDPRQPAETVLDIQTTCTNRDVPGRFQRGGDTLFLGRKGPSPVTIRCLASPTSPLRPPLRRSAHWRLVAQNSLNHLPLSTPGEGRLALQEILRLCDFSQPGQQLNSTVQQLIEGISSLSCRRVLGRRSGPKAIGVCHGMEFIVELDEKKFVGVGMFLFASVLERFLGYYAAVNAFSQLIARNKQGEGIIKQWPPRSADQQIL